jgi:predicted SprT family Zn-dependent metalloprotease
MQNAPALHPAYQSAKLKVGATTVEHAAFDIAFKFFNRGLFQDKLPDCLITLQRKNKTYGYFHCGRFGARDGSNVADEIALNPATFRNRSDKEILSTLVHEMTHCWQAHFGKLSPNRYHNRQWADKMEEVGLTPSRNGKPGGKRTGQKMTHYITPDGPFDLVANALTAQGFQIAYVETGFRQISGATDRSSNGQNASLANSRNKTRFCCSSCGVKAWGAPKLEIDCAVCKKRMTP